MGTLDRYRGFPHGPVGLSLVNFGPSPAAPGPVTNKIPDDPLPVRSEGAAEPTRATERMLALMETAIADLPADTRSVFLLHRFRDLSYTQIAEVMNLSTSTVVRKMAEALERLAAVVEAGV